MYTKEKLVKYTWKKSFLMFPDFNTAEFNSLLS